MKNKTNNIEFLTYEEFMQFAHDTALIFNVHIALKEIKYDGRKKIEIHGAENTCLIINFSLAKKLLPDLPIYKIELGDMFFTNAKIELNNYNE